MFQFLRRLIGELGKQPSTPITTESNDVKSLADFARLNAEVPLQSVNEKQNAFVRREAILDRSEKIAGYEFSLLTAIHDRVNRHSGKGRRAYDAALLIRLTLHGVTSLLGHRLAFISLSADSLSDPTIIKLPEKNSVLMIDVPPETADWAVIDEHLAKLKENGFFIGLKINDPKDASCPLRHQMDFIQIDVAEFVGIDLKSLVRELTKNQPNETPHRLIASNVQSHEDFQFCYKNGFNYFHGPFITRRESFRPVKSEINRMVVFSILKLLRSDQAFSLIADQLKNEPAMTYKLLRYINSPAMGLSQPINNLTQALVLTGRDKFYRWISLLLFDFEKPGYSEHMLAERALTRGRTLELLAGKGRIPPAPDQLFLIGLFSLLDVALGEPMPELLEKASLPEAVRDALLGKPGSYADALTLVSLGEADTSTQENVIAQALDRCGISDADYAPVAASALIWANQALNGAS